MDIWQTPPRTRQTNYKLITQYIMLKENNMKKQTLQELIEDNSESNRRMIERILFLIFNQYNIKTGNDVEKAIIKEVDREYKHSTQKILQWIVDKGEEEINKIKKMDYRHDFTGMFKVCDEEQKKGINKLLSPIKSVLNKK